MGQHGRSALTQFREGSHAWWETAISDVSPGRITFRGVPIADLLTSSYAGVVALLVGDLHLSPAQVRLLDAALIAGMDHGVRAPSIAAARMAATCGVPLNCAVATGMNLLGEFHGGANEACAELLESTLAAATGPSASFEAAAAAVVSKRIASGEPLPGFGHQLHKDGDPRRDPMLRLLQQAVDRGDIRGLHLRSALALEAALEQAKRRRIRLNVDGLTAIVYGELGFPPAAAKGLFCLSRGVGIVAHALEEARGGARIKGPCPPGEEVRYVGPLAK